MFPIKRQERTGEAKRKSLWLLSCCFGFLGATFVESDNSKQFTGAKLG